MFFADRYDWNKHRRTSNCTYLNSSVMHQGCSGIQFSSVAQSCPTLRDPMDHSTPGLPVHHQLPEFTQIHLHWVDDAIQPSHPLPSPSPALSLSQHQGLFQWVLLASGGRRIGASASASVLWMNIQSWFPLGQAPLWFSWWRIRLQCRRPGFDPWVGKIPWERERPPTPVFWPGEFHELYSPWGCKESDTTE